MSFLIIGVTVAAASPQHVLDGKVSSSVESYFASCLEGNSAEFKSKVTFKPGQAAGAEVEVWKLWQRANSNLDEEKLPELKPLTDGVNGVWHLPASLEPNAAMPFYWGSKGQAGRYPLFVYMHGSGPKQAEWRNGLLLSRYFKDGPSVYFVPQIPNEGEYYRWWQKAKLHAWDKLLRQSMASDVIDPDKIYFFGISEGGYGSQRLASYYADYLAGAGPMAGGEPLVNAPVENLGNTAFSLRTGAEDQGFYRNKLTRYTAEALDSMENGYPGQYKHWVELIPGHGHGIDYAATTPWLRGNTRNPWPRHIIWENFEIDGLYRDAFYNIKVNERSNPDFDTRTVYYMDIVDNEIHVNVYLVKYKLIEKDSIWGIGLKYEKEYEKATRGDFTVYLNDKLVDFSQPVKVILNGKTVFKGKVKERLADMVNSCALFGDPRRVYTASVKVKL